jgi:exosortase
MMPIEHEPSYSTLPAATSTAGRPANWPFAAAVLAAGFVVAYHDVFRGLLREWSTNDNYSHGFLVIPIAAYFAWERRQSLRDATPKPTWLGLPVIAAGIAALAVGTLGAELFLSRVSPVIVLAGTVLFLAGWRHLRILAMPLAFLLLMVPIPAIVFNQVAFPLQLLASRFGQSALSLWGIPVLREGNVITLANATLEVAEACSGIRSLVSLLTLSIVYAHFSEPRRAIRALLIFSTVPIAIATNGFRVAAIGIAAHYSGPQAAEGAFHTASGWLVFAAAFALLLLVHRVAMFFGRPWPSARLKSQAVTS